LFTVKALQKSLFSCILTRVPPLHAEVSHSTTAERLIQSSS